MSDNLAFFMHFSKNKQFKPTHEINVKFINGNSILINVDNQTTGLEACAMVASQIYLDSFVDFRLFFYSDRGLVRMIDNYEYILSALHDLDKKYEDSKTCLNYI